MREGIPCTRMDDYTFAWREMAALPPRHIRTDLAPGDFYDAVLAAIRDDYALGPMPGPQGSPSPP